MLARNAFFGVAVAIFDERASSGHERDHRRDPGLRAETGEDLFRVPEQVARPSVVPAGRVHDGEGRLDPDELVEGTSLPVQRDRLDAEVVDVISGSRALVAERARRGRPRARSRGHG